MLMKSLVASGDEQAAALGGEFRSMLPDVEGRRAKVLSLRARRYTQLQIAQALQVDQATVSRDLAWIREHWAEKFGSPSKLEPPEEIGEAIALFAEVEMQALRDFSKLKTSEARSRNAYLRTALIARQMRVNLLRDLGFIDRQIGNIGVTLRADAVRQALRDAGLLITDDGHITVGQNDKDDEVARRRRQAG